MGTDKRDRQKANKQAKLEAERAAEAKAKRMRSIRNLVVVAVIVVVTMVILTLTSCSSDSDGATKVDAGSEGSAESTDADAPPSSSSSDADYGTGECPPEDGVDEPKLTFDDAFQRCIDLDATYTAAIETTEGDVTMVLDPSKGAPIAVNNFVSLARSGYYDGVVMFRTEAPTGIIQTGSPTTQTGSDPGPGYSIPDEGLPWSSEDYGPGTVAMANSGPDTAGGQFFFLANEGGSYLGDTAAIGESAGAYTVFGKITDGLDVLVSIAELDTGAGTPSKEAKITKVTITED